MNLPKPFSPNSCPRIRPLLGIFHFIALLFFANALSAQDCNTPYIRRIGDAGIAEKAYKVIPAPDGNLLIGGNKNNGALLMLATPGGEIIWERTFDFNTGQDFIHDMMIDAEGKLVAVGRDQYNTSTVCFIMRYDLQAQSVLWSSKLPNPAYSRLEGVLQLPNQNYLVYGMTDHGGNLDNLIFEVNKNTGAQVWMKSFNSGQTDVFFNAIVKNNAIYTANVQRNGGLEKMRASISKLDLTGNQVWTKNYLRDFATSARTYAMAIEAANDTLAVFGHGNLAGSDEPNFTLQFFTTDLDGNPFWAKQYQLPGNNHIAGSISKLTDGYILQGTYTRALRTEIFVMKVDKQGNPVWAKSIGGTENETSESVLVHSGSIYFVGHSEEFDTQQDILLGKMTLNGELIGAACDFVETVQVATTNIPNPFSGLQTFVTVPANHPFAASMNSPVSVTSPIADFPGCGCQAVGVCNNLLSNPSFENGLTNWNLTGTVSTSTDAQSGTGAAKICGSAPGSIGQIYPAQAGESYTASVWAKTDNPPNNAYAQLRFLNSSYTPLASGTDQQFFYNTSYDQYNLQATAPTGTAYVHLLIWKQGTVCATVDAMELCKETAPVPQPDLAVSGLAVLNSPVQQGGNPALTFTLTNLGNSAVNGAYHVKVYVSTSSSLGPNSVLLETIQQQNTAAGANLPFSISPVLPASLVPGSYFIIAVADSEQTIPETNEGNNTASVSFIYQTIPPVVCSGIYILQTQAQVDAFPGCTQLDGILSIGGSNIQDLTPLSTLTSVSQEIKIEVNPMLTSLQGLHNITTTNRLYVRYNANLTDLTGLSGLSGSLSEMEISNNAKLASLNGLQGLTTLNGISTISNNPMLTSLNGLNHVSNAYILDIRENHALPNLQGLNGLGSVGNILRIRMNNSMVNLQGLNNLTNATQELSIMDMPALANFDGLEKFKTTNWMRILNNAVLTNVDAFAVSLFKIFNTLEIKDNPLLADCCGFLSFLQSPASNQLGAQISNNLPNCNSVTAITTSCINTSSIDLSLTITSPTTAPIFTSYPVAIKVTNSGSIPATGVKVICQKPNGVVYTGGNEYTATQGSFGSFTNQEWTVGTLAPGATATLTLNYFLLQTSLPLVYAQVTAANETDADSSPNNGTPPTPNEDDEASSAGAPPPPPPTQPDLTLSDLVAPTSIGPGTGNFTFTLKNIGTAAVQGNYQIGSFLSTDNVLSANDYAFATIPESNTAVGSYPRTGSFLLPVGFAPGNYYLIVKVDVGSAVAESNENNNTLSSPVTIPGVSCDGNYVLTTQAQVNTFPSCPLVNGNLRISGADIVDLTPLAGLTSVTGLLEVVNNASLSSLQGLNNIASVGGMMVSNNPLLTSLAPLSNLHHDAILPLTIDNNPLLTNLNGLQGITGANYLRINGNAGLQTLMGLNNLAIVRGEFLVTSNSSLQNFDALTKLTTLQSTLIMDDNPLLANLNGLSNLKTIGGTLFLYGTNSLLDLHGLHNLTSVFGIDIKDNTLLQNLDALSGISALNSLRVRNNAVLSDCCGLYPVLSANGVSGVIEIQGNPNGCNNQLDIVSSCVPQGVDLQLAMTSTLPNPPIYTNFPVKLTITNAGGQAATGVKVHFPRPTGVVYVGGNEFTLTQGGFNAFGNEQWFVGNLAAGASASLTVNYFLLTSNALHPYAQVVGCDQADSDSSPNNGTSPNPSEDDEATLSINGFAGNNSGTSLAKTDNRQRLNMDWVYPNPTKYLVNLEVFSPEEQPAVLDFYDQQGRVVYSLNTELEEGTNNVQVFVFDWKSGTYNVIARGEKTGLPAYGRFLKVWEE